MELDQYIRLDYSPDDRQFHFSSLEDARVYPGWYVMARLIPEQIAWEFAAFGSRLLYRNKNRRYSRYDMQEVFQRWVKRTLKKGPLLKEEVREYYQLAYSTSCSEFLATEIGFKVTTNSWHVIAHRMHVQHIAKFTDKARSLTLRCGERIPTHLMREQLVMFMQAQEQSKDSIKPILKAYK